MKREESSTLLTAAFCSLLIIISIGEVQARRLLQVCSSSCGDVENISYPFRLKSDPAGCGDPGYELSCENNKTILEFLSGRYYVKNISYKENKIRVVDVNLANGSCNLPYHSLSDDGVRADSRYSAGFLVPNCISFVGCLKNISDPTYRSVPCRSSNTSYVYVIYGSCSISGIPESCQFNSMVPTIVNMQEKYPSYEAIVKALQSGFELEWSLECRRVSGGSEYSTLRRVSYQCGEYMSIVHFIISSIIVILIPALRVLFLITRFIFGPLVILVFLIHKFQTTRKTVDALEKFLRNQQFLMPKRYSYTEIVAMTNHFREKLGEGGFGSVYKGQLGGGCLVAVKMLGNSKFSGEDFINEVATIGRIHHVNVVPLVGFCSEGSKRALVYEYMLNGSLDKHIFSKKGKAPSLSWEKLHEIALGTARGIEYLHGGCDMRILHFDIKPHNVLLDHNFVPKIADFGLAKFYPREHDFVSVSTARGTIGYIAPELISRNFGAVSCKSDVYSFGMLLLEMAGGRKNVDAKAKSSSKVYFPSWVYDHLHQGGNLELVNVTEIEVKIAKNLCKVGLWCIQTKASDRPSMTKVVEMLEGNIDDLEMPPKPFWSSSPQHMSTNDSQLDSSTEQISKSLEERSNTNSGL